MFDPSARPDVKDDVLTFAAPMSKFSHMVENMGDSLLITPTSDKMRDRIAWVSKRG